MYGLSGALRAGRLGPPFPRSALAGLVPGDRIDPVRAVLVELSNQGMSGPHLATLLDVLAEERAAHQRMADRLDLVFSPPEMDRVDARDTSVVVRDLFRRAEHSLLIASFALDAGDRARALFGELAGRMDADPDLSVQLHVNVHRKHLDDTPASELVRAFARHFRDAVWPGERLPEVFYDPRSVEQEGQKRSVLHAKCVVVDDRWTLLSSANFTEAAQERNIEAGVVLDDKRMAERVRRQFDGLVEGGMLRALQPRSRSGGGVL